MHVSSGGRRTSPPRKPSWKSSSWQQPRRKPSNPSNRLAGHHPRELPVRPYRGIPGTTSRRKNTGTRPATRPHASVAPAPDSPCSRAQRRASRLPAARSRPSSHPCTACARATRPRRWRPQHNHACSRRPIHGHSDCAASGGRKETGLTETALNARLAICVHTARALKLDEYESGTSQAGAVASQTSA